MVFLNSSIFFSAETCHLYHKTRKCYVRIIIEILACVCVCFSFFFYALVWHSCVVCCHTIRNSMPIWCRWGVVMVLSFFGILKGLFCVVVMGWVVRNGASWGVTWSKWAWVSKVYLLHWILILFLPGYNSFEETNLEPCFHSQTHLTIIHNNSSQELILPLGT